MRRRSTAAGPKATPLFHNGKLYTVGISGAVSAFNAATGKLLWQKPAPAEHPYFGMAASPVGDKDLVMLHPGSYGPLTAYNSPPQEQSGGRRTAMAVYASPIMVELGSVRQIVSMTNKSVISVAVADGAPLWEHPWKPSGTDSAITPIVYGETIIVASHTGPVTALKPIRRDGKWTVEVVSENKDVSLFMCNPALIGDTLFGLSEKSSGQFFGIQRQDRQDTLAGSASRSVERSSRQSWRSPPYAERRRRVDSGAGQSDRIRTV